MRISTGLLSALLVVAGSVGCTGQNLCNRVAECRADDGDSLADDSTAVCVANYNTGLDALNANEEEECHILASAIAAVDACRAGLSCDDFEEDDLGRECDEQLNDLEEAVEDTDGIVAGYRVLSVGERCTAQED